MRKMFMTLFVLFLIFFSATACFADVSEPYVVDVGKSSDLDEQVVAARADEVAIEMKGEATAETFNLIATLSYVLGKALLYYSGIFSVFYLIDRTLSITNSILVRLLTFNKKTADEIPIPKFVVLMFLTTGVGLLLSSTFINYLIVKIMATSINYL